MFDIVGQTGGTLWRLIESLSLIWCESEVEKEANQHFFLFKNCIVATLSYMGLTVYCRRSEDFV